MLQLLVIENSSSWRREKLKHFFVEEKAELFQHSFNKIFQ